MAKKKQPTAETQLTTFKELMARSGVESFQYQNHTLITVIKNASILINVEPALWTILIEDEELKSKIKEIDPTTKFGSEKLPLFQYADDIKTDGWIDIDASILYSGKLVSVKLDNFTYEAIIGKESIPLKFRKAEFSNFAYRIYTSPNMMLVIKKEFPSIEDVPDTGFTIVRMYHIV